MTLGMGFGRILSTLHSKRCQALVDRILDSGTLEIDGVEVDYALYPIPRHHWAYRDDRPFIDASVRSPFSRHSAEIIEYWSFRAELRDRWLEVLESSPGGWPSRLMRIRFPARSACGPNWKPDDCGCRGRNRLRLDSPS